jgi:hypothetical protein
MSADPAGPVDGFNLYVYVSGNPVRKNDPGGMAENDEVDMVFTTNEQKEMVFTPKEVEEYQKAEAAKQADEDVAYMEFTLEETTAKNNGERTRVEKQSKDTEGATFELSLGVNVSGAIITHNVNVKILEDFLSGDIGYAITRDKSATAASVEIGLQGSAKGYNTDIDTINESSDITASAGMDIAGTDIGGGVVGTVLLDESGEQVGGGGGVNASFGLSGDPNPFDIQVGSTQSVLAEGKINMPAVYEEAVSIMTDFFENPAETFYQNYKDIAPKIDIFGIMD